MFDRPVYAMAALTIALLVSGSSARLAAQAPRAADDSMLHHIWALDAELRTRKHAVDSIRRSLARTPPSVEVRRGVLSVRTTHELETRVATALDATIALVDHRGGTALPHRLGAHTPMVVPDSARAMLGVVPLVVLTPDTSRRWSNRAAGITLPRTASSRQLAYWLTRYAEQFAAEGIDSAVTAWVMTNRIPLHRPTSAELADAYLELATTESVAVERCRGGDVLACLDALGIDSLPGSRLARWYVPAEYRSVVMRTAPPRDDSVVVAAWLRCREAYDADACGVAAAALPNASVPLPLSPAVRSLLLSEVLEAGGAGSYDPLLSRAATLRARLEAAAGEPLDHTVQRWLSRIEASRPRRARLGPGLALASLGWSVGLLGIAFGRRPSWT